jgi:copper(I)-binding protein
MEICLKRNAVIAAASALAGLALLGACGQPAQPEQEEQSATPAAPDAKPGLSISAAKLVLPAVSGNPAAAYLTLSNGGDKPAEVAGVHIAGAENTEIHQTSGGSMNLLESPQVPAKGTLEFAPGGNHVMVFGLDDSLKANTASEVTVTFSDGDKISAPIWIEAPGLSGEGN